MFTLYDANKQPQAVAGIGHSIGEQRWLEYHQNQKKFYSDSEQKDMQLTFLNILRSSLQLYPQTIQTEIDLLKASNKSNFWVLGGNEITKLTCREAQCLWQLRQGQSAKQTAINLNLSPRTIEIYIKNIKEKFKCRTKLELLSKINGSEFLTRKTYPKVKS